MTVLNFKLLLLFFILVNGFFVLYYIKRETDCVKEQIARDQIHKFIETTTTKDTEEQSTIEPKKPHVCEHVEEECKPDKMAKCITEQGGWKYPNEFPTKLGPMREFSVKCDDPLKKDRFCKYKNICLLNGQKKFDIFSRNHTLSDYFGNGKDKKYDRKISQNWSINGNITTTQKTVEWAEGTYIWVDPRYSKFLRQPGHFFETGFKIPELRKRFPGKIAGLILPRDRADLVEYVCQTFRLAFKLENFEVPPVYFLNDFYPSKMDNICFEEIITARVTNLYFGTRAEADYFRDTALEMCEIPERKNVTKLENVFKIDRGGRQLVNWQELCDLPEMSKYNINTKCFEMLPFCEQIKLIYWGDIIIANHGSSIALVAFARKGSVLIDLIPRKLRNPDLKTVAYYSSVRYLEFMNMNDTRTGQIIHHKMFETNAECLNSSVIMLKKKNNWNCFRWYQAHHQIWYPHNFLQYIKEAERIWNHPNEFGLCELPGALNYREPFWNMQTEGNWLLCEPEEVNYCNQDPNCYVQPDGDWGPFEPNIVLQNYNKLK